MISISCWHRERYQKRKLAVLYFGNTSWKQFGRWRGAGGQRKRVVIATLFLIFWPTSQKVAAQEQHQHWVLICMCSCRTVATHISSSIWIQSSFTVRQAEIVSGRGHRQLSRRWHINWVVRKDKQRSQWSAAAVSLMCTTTQHHSSVWQTEAEEGAITVL